MATPLANVDLNLLVALRTLLEERSVTRAAERLFITQPAMSKTLQRLRDLFEDDLFTRSARGLVPTPKALELEQPLQVALEYLESNVFGTEFDPAQAAAEIHICAPEMFAITAVPELTIMLTKEAPGVLLQSRNLLDDYIELLAHGSLDFAIYINQNLSDDFATFPIITGAPSIWLPADHPLTSNPTIDLADLRDVPSVSVYLPGISATGMQGLQNVFAAHGVTLQPIIQTTQLLIAMEVISRKGAFMMGPQLIDNSMLASGSVVSRPISNDEITKGVQLELVLIQHQRTLNSPLHNWIRERILRIYQGYEQAM